MTLEEKVVEWGECRGILDGKGAERQLLKTVSEIGELADSLLKYDKIGIKDGIGDILVTLIFVAHKCGFNLTECLEYAYNQIKNRTGKTVNGVFIKDE